MNAQREIETYPVSYIIQETTQWCICCKRKHTFSILYAKTELRSRLGAAAKPVLQYRPVTAATQLYNLPIEKHKLPDVMIPFCHACNEPTLYDLPSAPEPVRPGQVFGPGTSEAPKAQPRSAPRPTRLDKLLDL